MHTHQERNPGLPNLREWRVQRMGDDGNDLIEAAVRVAPIQDVGDAQPPIAPSRKGPEISDRAVKSLW